MVSIIVLAAGQSKRMNSKLSKVLHPIGGLPIIRHVLKAILGVQPRQIIIVTSKALAPEFKDHNVIIQDDPKGTGHAVQVALEALDEKTQDVLIVCGDTPLIQSQTLKTLKESQADLCVATMRVQNKDHAYGLVIQDDQGNPQKIVEFKDANPDQRQIPLCNAGVYKIKASVLRELLPLLETKNEAKEYYLTDLVEFAHQRSYKTAVVIGDEEEFHGINTRLDLARAEAIFQNRWRLQKMQEGVTLVQPETIFLSHDTKIGVDSRVGPFVTFGEGVCLKDNVTILPFCHLEHTVVEDGGTVGPFAHLRGNTVLHQGASIGNFVEVKGSKIGKGSKAKHLSYIGDTDVGEKVNIGAGAITCNYDGFKKYKTVIEDGVMVGVNASLVAPLTIGQGSIVAAGSTITESVQIDALAIARTPQTQKPGWAKKFRDKQ